MTVIRAGDIVRLEGPVKYGREITGYDEIVLDIGGRTVRVPESSVTVIVPRFEIGEPVYGKYGDIAGVVLGVAGDRVWVKSTSGVFDTWSAESLRRATEEDDAAVAATPTLIETPPPPAPPYVVTTAELRTGGTLADA